VRDRLPGREAFFELETDWWAAETLAPVSLFARKYTPSYWKNAGWLNRFSNAFVQFFDCWKCNLDVLFLIK